MTDAGARGRKGASRGAGEDARWVSASEVAEVAYCARAYRLQHVEKRAVAGEVRERLTAGVAAHAAHGRAYAAQQRLLTVGGVALVVAVALGAIAWVAGRLGW